MQISQEACQVVWYSHLFQNFPHFIVIHTDKDFGIVNKAEIDVFLKLVTGWLLLAAAPGLGCRVAPLAPSCTVAAWHSRPLPLTSDVG